jgi:RNA polymerase sigma-70 factor (sigma-E family)
VAADIAGFDEFARARYSALLRLAFLPVGDRGIAEDLVQTALFQTFRSWGRLRAAQAAEAYTRTTMVRLAVRWSRRRWHREIPTLDLPEPVHQEWVESITDAQRALSRLPWQQRAVLVLRFFDDLTEAQTADALGCSLGTVKSRSSRGLARLRADGLLRANPMEEEIPRG